LPSIVTTRELKQQEGQQGKRVMPFSVMLIQSKWKHNNNYRNACIMQSSERQSVSQSVSQSARHVSQLDMRCAVVRNR